MHARTPRFALALALLTLLPSAAGCVAADTGADEDLEGPPSQPLGARLSGTSVGPVEVNDPEATVNDPEVNDPESTVNDPEVNDPEATVNDPEVNDPESTVNDPEVNDPESTVNDPEVNDPEARICLENDVNCDGASQL